MNEQWEELKETITELRDSNGTGTQQEVCKFLTNYMEVLEKQMQEPCGNAISRQAAIDAIHRVGMCKCSTDEIQVADECSRAVGDLPPITPQSKTGRWIYGEDNLGTGRDGWYCNQCGHFEFWDYSSDMKSAKLNLPNPCPNCGAKMVEPQERNEKE